MLGGMGSSATSTSPTAGRRSLRWLVASLLVAAGLYACQTTPAGGRVVATDLAADRGTELGTDAHRDEVMTSRFCGTCHPAIYDEHRQNTHGLAFHDEEARLATRGFRRDDCVRCHTPRPVFETGIGMTPMVRWTNLDEGNTCMSCHGKAGVDYRTFVGGAECKTAFDPRVGTVEDCASCHRIAGTPDQWSRAEHGNQSGRVCIDCHMPTVTRPVAVGMPPRPVRSHVFPASSSESQLRRAYEYDAQIDGNEVVVHITNKGVGHNFPTANRQRGVESLVIVRDAEGHEIARSRMVCHYPYASELQPHQLTPPQSSQIPSGKTTEHRVPIGTAAGTVECRLYFKLYRPIADTDERLSRCLEDRRLPFVGVTPSTVAVDPSPEVTYPVAPTELNDFLSPSGLANVARSGKPDPVVLPAGNSEAELAKIAAQLESHLPEVRKLARERLAAAFPASAAPLVLALCRWSNETFHEAQKTFLAIGAPAVPTLRQALQHEHLYVRVHARELLAQLDLGSDRDAVLTALRAALAADNPLDRRSSALALGQLGDRDATVALRARLADGDPDVVLAAAASLAQLGDTASVPPLTALARAARWPEARRGLAIALARLGSAAGITPLLRDLDQDDVLQREYAFAALTSITGRHFGYEPAAPQRDRLRALSAWQSWWSANADDALVHAPQDVAPAVQQRAWAAVEQLGGGTDTVAGGDDAALLQELTGLDADAVPALLEGLTFPVGFADKRALLCQALGHIGSKQAAPALLATLRDPVPTVTEWACWALETCGDTDCLAPLRAYADRVPALVGADRGADGETLTDRLLARAARTRLMLGEERARDELVGLLLSPNEDARTLAIGALRDHFGEDRGFDAKAPVAERLAAAQRWH